MHAHAHPLPRPVVISLRPRGQHALLRQQVAAAGGHLLALSPWAIQPRRTAAARQALRRALACPLVIVTSPAAVAAADALVPLASALPMPRWLAVGQGTARALQAVTSVQVQAPQRMDSEGLLALPALQDIAGQTVGLLTAPGGRGTIPAGLARAGARCVQADVYDRRIVAVPGRLRARLHRLAAGDILLLSSGKALEQLWRQLDPGQRAALCRCTVVAASARLADLARAQGFVHIRQAASALPGDLLAASPLPGQG